MATWGDSDPFRCMSCRRAVSPLDSAAYRRCWECGHAWRFAATLAIRDWWRRCLIFGWRRPRRGRDVAICPCCHAGL